MLKVKDLETYHGRIQVLKGVSLDVHKGEIVTLIGANGAGKSTLLGTLAGLYPSAKGQVFLDGEMVNHLPAEKIVSKGISLVPEGREVFDALSVMDNLTLGSYHRYEKAKPQLEKELEQIFTLFPALRGKEKQLAGTLSGGEQQMLAIGRGLMAQPKVLLLDEPSVGLAPLIVKEIFNILMDLKKQGTTILLVEQNAKAALKLADRAYVMERGQIFLSGRASELLEDQRVQSAYLGGKLNIS